MPELIRERALELISQAEEAERQSQPSVGQPPLRSSSRTLTQDLIWTLFSLAVASTLVSSESEKVLLRLAITHGVLVKIGFTDERIEQCLNALTSGWELDDAMDWVSTSHLYMVVASNERQN